MTFNCSFELIDYLMLTKKYAESHTLCAEITVFRARSELNSGQKLNETNLINL